MSYSGENDSKKCTMNTKDQLDFQIRNDVSWNELKISSWKETKIKICTEKLYYIYIKVYLYAYKI